MSKLRELTNFLRNGDIILMNEIQHYAIAKILSRTAVGKDYKGINFRPYSEGYKKVRSKKGLPTAKVDLFFTGKMLGSLTFENKAKTIKLFFADPESSKKAYFNNRTREFFNISDDDEMKFKEMIQQHIARILH